MTILFFGDIYDEVGLSLIEQELPKLKKEHNPNVIICNAENIHNGRGLNLKEYKRLMALGVHMITLGNHGYDTHEIQDFIDEANVVRPLNYGDTAPGVGVKTINYNGTKVAVMQVMGRIFMGDPLDDPFKTLDNTLNTLEADVIILDVHAEATSEKIAIGHHVDGRVHVVIGTHTHVQTNDAHKLPKGTLYITDVGMNGALDGILGADKDVILSRFKTHMPIRITAQKTGRKQVSAVLCDLDKKTIRPIHYIKEV
jgi:metallophosphoesterase (TIGR00282 family)